MQIHTASLNFMVVTNEGNKRDARCSTRSLISYYSSRCVLMRNKEDSLNMKLFVRGVGGIVSIS